MTTNRTHGFSNFGEQLLAVRDFATSGHADSRLQASAGLNTAIDSEGGFCLAPQFESEIIVKAENSDEILNRCDRRQATSKLYQRPNIHENSRADGSRYGGARFYFVEDGEEITASHPTFGMQNMKLRKGAVLVYITNEAMEDVANLGVAVTDIAGMEFAYGLADLVVNGTGAGQPLGLLNSPAKITVSKETNQTAATAWAVNIEKMMARLWVGSWKPACWLFHPELLPQLSALKNEGRYSSGSTAADSAAMWDWGRNGYPYLCGRPAIPCEHCQAPGTEGDLILTDLSQYLLPLRSRSQSSAHVAFLTDEQVFRFAWQIDGQCTWASALTPDHGTNTLSPIVTLETRE